MSESGSPIRVPSAAPPGHGRFNTLGLPPEDLNALLDTLDRNEAAATQSGRHYLRCSFRAPSLPLHVAHEGGEAIPIPVAARNLSRTGLAVLHNAAMNPGTRCVAMLPHPAEGELAVPGVIARCRCLMGNVHEIGIVFAMPIDVQAILSRNTLPDQAAPESTPPESLAGRILVASGSPFDAGIVAHHLADSPAAIESVQTLTQAAVAIKSQPDLLLADLKLADAGAGAAIAVAHRSGYSGPIIVMSESSADQTRALLGDARVSAIIAKPLPRTALRRMVSEFLAIRREAVGKPARKRAA